MLEYTLDPGQTPRFFTRLFSRLFSRLFNCSYFRNVYQLKLFAITNIFPSNETLLRMFSLDFLDKVAKRVDFHSTTIPYSVIYVTEQFTRVSYITSRTSRSSNLSLWPSRSKSRNGENFFACKLSSVWNSLPSEITSFRTFGSF